MTNIEAAKRRIAEILFALDPVKSNSLHWKELVLGGWETELPLAHPTMRIFACVSHDGIGAVEVQDDGKHIVTLAYEDLSYKESYTTDTQSPCKSEN